MHHLRWQYGALRLAELRLGRRWCRVTVQYLVKLPQQRIITLRVGEITPHNDPLQVVLLDILCLILHRLRIVVANKFTPRSIIEIRRFACVVPVTSIAILINILSLESVIRGVVLASLLSIANGLV